MTENKSNISFIFFGSSDFAVRVLNILASDNLLPSLVITSPDKPKGRGMKIEESPVKVWARSKHIDSYEPDSLKAPEVLDKLKQYDSQMYVVVDYGKIIPSSIFEYPKYRTLNLHPSLLPDLRGPSPIENTILKSKNPAVTIMLIDDKMDTGDILKQEIYKDAKNLGKKDLQKILADRGALLLSEVMRDWVSEKISPTSQKNSEATYTHKVSKANGEIDLNDNSEKNLNKFKAYEDWPGTYFFHENKKGVIKRVIVKDAKISDGKFTPIKIIPEGKKEMFWEDYLRG